MHLTLISGFKPVYKSFEKIVLALLCDAGYGGFVSKGDVVLFQFSLAFIYLVILGISNVILKYVKCIIVAEATPTRSCVKNYCKASFKF